MLCFKGVTATVSMLCFKGGCHCVWVPASSICLYRHAAAAAACRDSLGALAGAIKEFGGGVVIISHHNEFTTALCPEKWTVAEGKCVVTGAPQVLTREKVEFKVQEEVTDAFGNTIKVRAGTLPGVCLLWPARLLNP
jgi:hypothetical protein